MADEEFMMLLAAVSYFKRAVRFIFLPFKNAQHNFNVGTADFAPTLSSECMEIVIYR